MTNATANTATENTNAAAAGTNAAPATAVVAAPKAPSKKSLALTIFNEQMAKRAAGEFESNKAFRRTVLDRIVAELEVTMASASTMYNSAKKDAETADATVGLGRDPKKEKVVSTTGKRGRPVGSKNKPKEGANNAAPAGEAVAEGTGEVKDPADTTVVVDVQVDAQDPVAPAADTEALPA